MNSINFSKIDRITDYVPVVSTFTNLYALFIKTVVISRCDQSQIDQSPHYTHLNCKDARLCLALLVPVLGNACVAVYRFLYRDSNNYSKMIINIHNDPSQVRHASWALRENRKFVIDAIKEVADNARWSIGENLAKNMQTLFQHLPKRWLEDKEVRDCLRREAPSLRFTVSKRAQA